MELYDIIDSLNQAIQDKRLKHNINKSSYLVVIEQVIPNEVHKLYKSYECTLWYIDSDIKQKVMMISQFKRLPEYEEEAMKFKVRKQFIKTLFLWIGSKSYAEVVNGIYNGNEI